ncbi:MAG: hypothetical protein M0038_07555 [Pseudomonadota bacterium]|jgi:hypothetical protein|nr:hypothetical protein [Pseudomonadota bacterium]
MIQLEDLKRLKVTSETKAYLYAEARRLGCSMHEVARAELHRIAVEKIHAAKVLVSLSPREAREGDSQSERVPVIDLRREAAQ